MNTTETVEAIIKMITEEADRYKEVPGNQSYAFSCVYYTLIGLAGNIRMLYGPVDGTALGIKDMQGEPW